MEKLVEFPKLGLEFIFKNSFNIGNITITWYGVIIAVGLLLGLLYAFKNFKRFGIDDNRAIDVIIGGIIGGILGARLYYVAFSWGDYGLDFSSWSAFWETFSRIFKTWEGGMAIYGGIIGAILIGIIIAKIRKVKVAPMLDVVGLGFLIGQCIGRWGNFINVEAFGNNTTMPWGMTSPSITSYLQANMETFSKYGIAVDPSLPVHPTFLYESLWCLLGFIVLHFFSKKRSFDGEVFLYYIVWYGAGRTVIEGFRTDSLMFGFLRVSQILSVLLVLVALAVIVTVKLKIKANNDPDYLKLYVNSDEWLEFMKKQEKLEDDEGANVPYSSSQEEVEEVIEEEQSEQDDDIEIDEVSDNEDKQN